jgi:fatty-acyl-CoA synthase
MVRGLLRAAADPARSVTSRGTVGPVSAGGTTAELLAARADDPHAGLLFADRSYSWARIVAEGRRRAVLALARRRTGPFHIGVLLDNTPEYLFWLVASALTGAVAVGINPTRRGAQLASDIRHVDCQLIITDGAHRNLVDGLDTGVAAERVLEVGGDRYRGLLAEQSAEERLDVAIDPAMPMLLMFTSGSTGAPKAVICGQGRFARSAHYMTGRLGLGRDDVAYNAMPMFHGNALMACWAPMLAVGGTWALRERFSASAFLPDVRRFGATYANYVGRALAYILATPERPDDADNPLRLVYGTEAADKDLAEFPRRFGCRCVEGYGSSEGPIAIGRMPGTPPGALGLPTTESDVAVVDTETGVECPRVRFGPHGEIANPAAIGELVRRDSRFVFEGYYRNPAATAQRLRGGWYWSGDLGYRDAAGYFYFAGRGNDWLRVDSENFAAAPVEHILARSPAVLVVAVYPVPDPRTGDQVMAALELDPGARFDPEEFDGFLAEQPDLGSKWSPRFVRVVESMPLTPTNKLDKKPLRGQAWECADPVWWRPSPAAPLRRITGADQMALRAEFAANGRTGLPHPGQVSGG